MGFVMVPGVVASLDGLARIVLRKFVPMTALATGCVASVFATAMRSGRVLPVSPKFAPTTALDMDNATMARVVVSVASRDLTVL